MYKYTVLLHWSTSNITNFFSPAPLSTPPIIPPVSADITEKATFLVFEEKMWRSQEGGNTADRVVTRRWRRRDKPVESCADTSDFLPGSVLPSLLYLIPLAQAYPRTHPCTVSLQSPRSAHRPFMFSPKSSQHAAVGRLLLQWGLEELERVVINLFILFSLSWRWSSWI